MVNALSRNDIPKLTENITIIPYKTNIFTLCLDSGSRPIKLNVDSYTKQLIEQIDGVRNIEELTESFNYENNFSLTVDETIKVFQEKILGYGILEKDNTNKIKIKDKYLSLRFIIFSTKLVRVLASPLTFLFAEWLFRRLFIFMTLLLVISLSFFLQLDQLYVDLSPNLLSYIFLLNLIAVLFHEFGHAAACLSFGAKNGPIGFGFYIISPVFYSDVSDAWRLNRKQRIIVDLGGIYLQMLICSLVVIAFYIFQNQAILQVAFWMFMATLINLSPFLRYDGYWALSDLLEISNLKEKSQKTVNSFFGKMIGINKSWKFEEQNKFLLVYGLSRTVVLIIFLIYILFFQSDSMLLFPKKLSLALITIFSDFDSISFEWVKSTIAELFIPTIFLIILIRETIKYFKKKIISLIKKMNLKRDSEKSN